MYEIELWQAVSARLKQGDHCMLMAVVDSQGSSPGKVGALMAIASDGPLAGTVGGGRVERECVDRAIDRLGRRELQPLLLPKVHWPEVANSSGMTCGGQQTLAMVALQPQDLAAVSELLARLNAGEAVGWMLSAAGWRLKSRPQAPSGLGGDAEDWCYHHCSSLGRPVYLIGGGHVSLALTRLLVDLGFRVTVIEERTDVATLEQNRSAWQRLQCGYESLADVVTLGPDVFVAIMTHDHERDAVALRAFLTALADDQSLGYLGLLGSRAKIRQLLAAQRLNALQAKPWFHAPMGIEIGSHTPQEIAVSIAAQMIAFRNGVGTLGNESGCQV